MSMLWTARVSVLALTIATLTACNSDSSNPPAPGTNSPAGALAGSGATSFTVTPLLSGQGNVARSRIINPSGLIFSDTLAWIANAGTGTLSPVSPEGAPQPPRVQLADGSSLDARPSGMVFNASSTDFYITARSLRVPATVIYATENGTLAAWSASAGFGNSAVTVYDGGGRDAVYKGLAQLNVSGTRYLYATDFRHGRIDTFDTNFARISSTGGFVDPELPADYKPFGIHAIGDNLIVTYAKQGDNDEAETGAGRGYISEFDSSGRFLRRVASGGELDAPWGVAVAPASFGSFGSRLLVGNFGNGRITAWNIDTGEYSGTLQNADGSPLVIPGLWAIVFGNGVAGQPIDSLFFTAGTPDGNNGLYGRIDDGGLVCQGNTGGTGTTGSGTGTGTGTGTTGAGAGAGVNSGAGTGSGNTTGNASSNAANNGAALAGGNGGTPRSGSTTNSGNTSSNGNAGNTNIGGNNAGNSTDGGTNSGTICKDPGIGSGAGAGTGTPGIRGAGGTSNTGAGTTGGGTGSNTNTGSSGATGGTNTGTGSGVNGGASGGINGGLNGDINGGANPGAGTSPRTGTTGTGTGGATGGGPLFQNTGGAIGGTGGTVGGGTAGAGTGGTSGTAAGSGSGAAL